MEKRYFSEIRIVEADGKPVIPGTPPYLIN
jgi:hypothetical protein